MTVNRSESDALRLAVEALGSQSETGRVLGVTQATVWKWLHHGKQLPAQHVILLESATGISRHDLRPDIYPRPPIADAPETAR